MLTLFAIANILIIAFAGASLANLFDDCLEEGMIFERYGRWVRINPAKWKKPIGGCLRCTSIWITILLILLFTWLKPVFFILAILGISNTALKYIIK